MFAHTEDRYLAGLDLSQEIWIKLWFGNGHPHQNQRRNVWCHRVSTVGCSFSFASLSCTPKLRCWIRDHPIEALDSQNDWVLAAMRDTLPRETSLFTTNWSGSALLAS